ncbi:hypothetical protein KY358_00510 [Candidatus Woesearchaeota archaeon]|nr:hypothetical protein [Candidatus Woesearchaeota archaeon]
MAFQKSLTKLQEAVSSAIKGGISLSDKPDKERAIYNFKEKQKAYCLNILRSSIRMVKKDSVEIMQLAKEGSKNQPYALDILSLMPELESKDLKKLEDTAEKMALLANRLSFPKDAPEHSFSIPNNIPEEIRPDASADIAELNRCFSSSCYRSSIILCGRLLETALHRKYYEITGNDLLEKSPGIGLGNIIVKLKEKSIRMDPGLTNQIHLINQARIFSVHKKKEAFYPTMQQTHAAILYTLDILEKLFS